MDTTVTKALDIITNDIFMKYKQLSIYESFVQLDKLRRLRDGWTIQEADVPNATAYTLINKVLTRLADTNLRPVFIDPSTAGGICIAFYHKDKYADIECFNDGDITASTAKKGGQIAIWYVSEDEVDDTIEKINIFIKE